MGAQLFVLQDGRSFFAPESVLSGGDRDTLAVAVYPQANKEVKKPSSLGQAGALRLLP